MEDNANPFYLDTHESIQLFDLLASLVPVKWSPLNDSHWADTMWLDAHGDTWQTENKAVSEIVGQMDSVKAQLQREAPMAKRTCLLVRGVALPDGDGMAVYKQAANKNVMYLEKVYRQNFVGYRAWLNARANEGIYVVEVPSMEAAAITLAQMYHWSQEAEHTALWDALVVEKFNLSEDDIIARNFMLSIMGIRKARWGEELAYALVAWCRSERLPLAIAALCSALEQRDMCLSLEQHPLRSGHRKVGSVAVSHLRTALGI